MDSQQGTTVSIQEALPWDAGPASDCLVPVVLQQISKRRLQVLQLMNTLINAVIKLLLEEQRQLSSQGRITEDGHVHTDTCTLQRALYL